MVGRSEGILKIISKCTLAAKSDSPVLIYGETGTGKELVAKRIHEESPRREGNFFSVNCAAINDNMLESELFGHVKGAYTGAISDRTGKFVEASRGTLFLDEIAEMSPACQAKILRTLQEKTVIPLGSNKKIGFDTRIIAATNKKLKNEIKTGHFRKDLYYRLLGFEIVVPPLRERRSDILTLSRHFLKKSGISVDIEFSDEVAQLLESYSWPGNVRQLEQAMSVVMAKLTGKTIEIEQLPEWLVNDFGEEFDIGLIPSALRKAEFQKTYEFHSEPYVEKPVSVKIMDMQTSSSGNLLILVSGKSDGKNCLYARSARTISSDELIFSSAPGERIAPSHLAPPDGDVRKLTEKEIIVEAIEQTRYSGTGRKNVAAAAKLLNMPRKSLQYRIKKLGIK